MKRLFVEVKSLGSSMEPLIKNNGRLLVNFSGDIEYRLGDIVVLWVQDKLLSHRIVWKKNGKYLIKGDNRSKIDGAFDKKDILGKVEKIFFQKNEINLQSIKHQLLKYLFALYSLVCKEVKFLIKLRTLAKVPVIKNLYRFIINT